MTAEQHPPERFDLCVLGAGPAGFAAAMRALDLGKRVLLVDGGRVGGTGLHEGALSSKTLWHLSNDYARACRLDRGYQLRDIAVSCAAVLDSVRDAVAERRAQLERQLRWAAAPRGAAAADRGTITHEAKGRGRFVSPHAVEVVPGDGGRAERYEAGFFLVATGSRPRVPDGIEVDGERVMTSDQIELLRDFPASMVVVGAGVVGCEYATMFANFRRSKINIIDRQPRILPFEDADVAAVVAHNFEQMGITIHRESRLESLRVKDGAVEYVLCTPEGVCAPIRVERALISVGRVPNTEALGLEAAGVARDAQGGIVAEQTRTSAPHVFAAGDVSADVALVNVAELEGRLAVEAMFGGTPAPIRYDALSAIYFLAPEVAAVGLNEQQARRRGVPYRVGVVSNQLVVRNIAMRYTGGFAKLLVAREAPHRVLGLRMVGPQAASAIQGIAYLIEQDATLEAIDRCVHPHPAVTEGVQECARLLLGRSILKPEVFGDELLRLGEG